MRIDAMDGTTAKATAGGSSIDVNVMLLENLSVGDYVLVHAGFAIRKIDEEEAVKTIETLNALVNK
jgi:hydrogenase expression/formation protein HypC